MPLDRDKATAFVEQITRFAAGATTIGLLAIADRTGLLRSMNGAGRATATETALRAGTDERYTREILSGLVAAGVVDYDAAGETFLLPDEHAAVVADDRSPYSMAGWFDMIPEAITHLDGIAEATRSGGGVSSEEFSERMTIGIDRANGPSMAFLLTRRWLTAMPDVVDKLEQGARVADIGCGSGAAIVAMAHAYPNSSFVGYDIDEPSIERAKLRTENLDNARFECRGWDALPDHAPFDLITTFDVVHDLASPHDAVAAIRRSIHDDGTYLLMEPRCAPALEDNLNERAALLYGVSTFYCMTQSLAQGGAGLGAAWGPHQAEQLCRSAGFSAFEELPIDNPFSAFYRVTP